MAGFAKPNTGCLCYCQNNLAFHSFIRIFATSKLFVLGNPQQSSFLITMKVLLINGSPKENGNTYIALCEVAKILNAEGVDTEIISIGKQAVQGCIACGMCG